MSITDVAKAQARGEQIEERKLPQNFAGLSAGQIKKTLDLMAPTLQKVLTGAMTCDQVIGAWVTILNDPNNYLVAKCTPQSVFGCMLKCAVHGLNPAPHRGEVALIPRNLHGTMTLCFQPMYRGVIKEVARNNPNIKRVYARVVKRGDEIQVFQGTEEKIIHNPKYIVTGETEADLEDSPDRPMVYGVIQYADGTYDFETMSKAQVNHVRDTCSKKDKDGDFSDAWTTWYAEKAKITVMLRLMKRALQYMDERTMDFLSRAHDVQPMSPDRALQAAKPAGEIKDAEVRELPNTPDPINPDNNGHLPDPPGNGHETRQEPVKPAIDLEGLYDMAGGRGLTAKDIESIWAGMLGFDLPIQEHAEPENMLAIEAYIQTDLASTESVKELESITGADRGRIDTVNQLLGGLPWKACRQKKIDEALDLLKQKRSGKR